MSTRVISRQRLARRVLTNSAWTVRVGQFRTPGEGACELVHGTLQVDRQLCGVKSLEQQSTQGLSRSVKP